MQTGPGHVMLLRVKLRAEETCNTQDLPTRQSVSMRVTMAMACLGVTSCCKNGTAALILEHFS